MKYSRTMDELGEPRGVNGDYTPHDCSENLPIEAVNKGMSLQSWTKGKRDPFCLHDDNGYILYQWPRDYIPSLTEVREASFSLIAD